jgi:hypothetical protein
MTDITPRRRLAAAMALGAALIAAPAMAHHGWGTYSTQEFEITGTVTTPLATAGPHATMQIKNGNQVWDLTLAPPNRTVAAGLKEGIIPVGATVTAHGHRSLDPKKFEVKTERVTWNSRVFDVCPDRD